jgi:hypothetical protein
MANSNANTANSHVAGGTALRGRIEAIGIFDLLRIAVGNGNTGRLLVFNDQFDAELYYVEGRLVVAIAGDAKGRDALVGVFGMTDGEFEFAQEIVAPPEQHDASLHDVMTAAIKNHYQERVRARQDSVSNLQAAKDRNDSVSSMPAVRASGTHLIVDDSRIAASPIVSIGPSSPTASSVSQPIPAITFSTALLDGEVGRANADHAGRTTTKLGIVSSQEAALATLVAKTAQSIATVLGMRDLTRLEIIGANDRALLCRLHKDGIRLSAISGTVDADLIWKELEP